MTQGTNPVLISSLHFEWSSVQHAFERCFDEFGLDGIEFSVVPGRTIPCLPEEDFAVAERLTREYGALTTGHVWKDIVQMGLSEGKDCLKEWAAMAHTCGMKLLVLHGCDHEDRQEGMDLYCRAIESAISEYEQADVTLALENRYPKAPEPRHLIHAEEFLHVFKRIPSRSLGFCLDTGHAHMTGNLFDLMTQLAPHWKYTHIDDNKGDKDDHLPFGCGTIPWAGWFDHARKVGYKGPYTTEFPVTRGDDEPLTAFLNGVRVKAD